MERREFLKGAGLVAGLAGSGAIAGEGPGGAPGESREGDMLYRILGRTGQRVSAIGVGGHHVGRIKDDAEAVRLVRTAIDRGINFLDNSWDYHGGRSEELMGRALEGGYRDKAFLMTKFDGRTREATARQIDESLRRLKTDRLDLLQVHEVIRLDDPDRCFAPGGAIEALEAARKAGKTRYVGFTGHKDPLVHLRMLDVAAAHGYRFDAVQMPLNVMDAHFRSFLREVLPRLVIEGIGVLGMKPMGDGNLLAGGEVSAVECLHFALNLPTATVITGMESMERLEQALAAVKSFRPLSADRVAALLDRTKKAAESGGREPFKTTERFDSTARHPEWMG